MFCFLVRDALAKCKNVFHATKCFCQSGLPPIALTHCIKTGNKSI